MVTDRGWRGLVDSGSDPSSVAASTPRVPLALGFELRMPRRDDANPWAPRRTVSADPRSLLAPGVEVSLAVRPLVRSVSTGEWVRSDVSWDSIRREPMRFVAAQRRWFLDLLAVVRDSLLSGTAGDWILLDHVESALFFSHLKRADQAGVPLVASQSHTDVRRVDQAAVSLHVNDVRGGLTVEAHTEIEGERAGQVHPIGRSGVYTWALEGSRLRVTLARVAVTDALLTLFHAGGVMTVPAHEREAFLREAYPVLARAHRVTAGPGVKLPPVPVPHAVLSASFSGGDTVDYLFEIAYEGFAPFPWKAAGLVHPVRDSLAEDTLRGTIEAVWAGSNDRPFAAVGRMRGVDTAEFADRTISALETYGVRVVVTGRRKTYRELVGDPEITVRTVESDDPDWFDLGVVVRIAGKNIPFSPLFTALSKRKKKMLLVDGSWLSLTHPALSRLRDLLDEAADLTEWQTTPRISRHQTTLWEDFEDLADQSEPAVSWRKTVDGLRETSRVPSIPIPVGLHAELRPYQREGLHWLAFLWHHRLGGVLADDMGLGKTLQILALIQHTREQHEPLPFLVIAPTSVLGTWRHEAARFAPQLTVQTIDRTHPDAWQGADAADIIVTSYTVARLTQARFSDREWAGVVLDEAQAVKNPKSEQHRAVATIRARTVIAVTGTPLENTLTDVWALFHLTAPGLFPSAQRFRSEYIKTIERSRVPDAVDQGLGRNARLARLRRRIRPLMLRRTKEQVARELPALQQQVLHVELSGEHRAHYDVVLQRERQKVLGLLEDLDHNRFTVFRSLTLLRMLSLAPELVDSADAHLGSRKLDVLTQRLRELTAEGHRALVFSQFTSYLDLAEQRLKDANISFVRLDGSTRDRQRVVDGFRHGTQPVFLISLKAGGTGLTLTEADYVFLLDPWWNPAVEQQAIDRTHRIGQHAPVTVYRMISSGTIEEKVLALQQRKADLFRAVVDDGNLFAATLTAEDIRALFDA